LKLRITIEGKTYEAEVEILEDEESEHPYVPYTPAPVSYTPPPISFTPSPPTLMGTNDGAKVYRSPVTGLVIRVSVEPGQLVQSNDVLMVLEAMKMENQVTATHAGTVKSVNVVPGNSVKVNQVLLEFE
jgi:methylmalonyl-CoA carboxyltransferase small subunit